MCFDLQNVNALSIDYYRGPNPSKSTLYFSTDSGHINTFIFDEDQLAKNCAQQNGSVEFHLIEKEGTTKLQNIGCISKRKTHNDWALKVRHFPELRSVISCSADEVNSLVIAETDINQKIQLHSVSIPRGVQTFAVSKAPLFIITGGRDRLLRLWNPHRLETPTSSLEGHLAPIVDITINEASNQILSLSSDKVVKVWDSRKQCCLQTISRNSREMPDDRLSNVLFIPDFGGSILTTSNSIYQYRLHQKLETTIHPQSHQDPVRCLASNSVFNQVISGCDGGVINVWVS
jgi:WD40 repeat protein